jgi:hypothetical protein
MRVDRSWKTSITPPRRRSWQLVLDQRTLLQKGAPLVKIQ